MCMHIHVVRANNNDSTPSWGKTNSSIDAALYDLEKGGEELIVLGALLFQAVLKHGMLWSQRRGERGWMGDD